MKRVLSVLLLIPFLCTQAWAIRGGPYDHLTFRDVSALAGVYGIAMYGMAATGGVYVKEQGLEKEDAAGVITSYAPDTGNSISTTAVFNLNLPAQGIADGKILLFHQGLMFVGGAKGMLVRKSQKLLLLSELSHYTVLSGATYTRTEGVEVTGVVVGGTAAVAPPPNAGGGNQNQNGVQASPVVILDRMLTGRIDLKLDLDYFTGLISASGYANYSEVRGKEGLGGAFEKWGIMRDFTSVSITRGPADPSNPGSGATSTTTETKAPIIDTLPQESDASLDLKLLAEGYRLTENLTSGTVEDYTVPAEETFFQIGGGAIDQQAAAGGGGVGGGGGGAGGGGGGARGGGGGGAAPPAGGALGALGGVGGGAAGAAPRVGP